MAEPLAFATKDASLSQQEHWFAFELTTSLTTRIWNAANPGCCYLSFLSWNYGNEFNGLVAEVFARMPAARNPHALSRFVVFFSAFAIGKSHFQVLVSEENNHTRSEVMHRNFFVRTDGDTNHLDSFILEFEFEGNWTAMYRLVVHARLRGVFGGRMVNRRLLRHRRHSQACKRSEDQQLCSHKGLLRWYNSPRGVQNRRILSRLKLPVNCKSNGHPMRLACSEWNCAHQRLHAIDFQRPGSFSLYGMNTIESLYQRRAARYDITANLYYFIGVREQSYRKSAVRAMQLRPGSRVLEVGCGTGLNFPLIQHWIGAEGSIVGLDLTSAMLERAGERVRKHGWSNATLVKGDARNAPNIAGPFDAVLCSFSLSALENPDRVLSLAHNSLREGGRLVVLDVKYSSYRLLNPIALWLTRYFGATEASLGWQPWKLMQSLFRNVSLRRYYFDFVFIASGEKSEQSQDQGPAPRS
jgi:ubiquinone/menaquinone biosynthesis C-methylase UbiE